MTIQEQITALLNGDMTDEAHVAELLHVLAVSPEKRALLVEQVAMSRAFTSMGTGVVPPAAADMKIMQGLAAIDAGFAATAPSAPPAEVPAEEGPSVVPAPLLTPFVKILLPLAGALLVAVGVGTGWLLWGGDARTAVVEHREAARTAPVAAAAPVANLSAALLAQARDSISTLHEQIAALDADRRDGVRRLAALANRPERVRVVYRDRPLAPAEHGVAEQAPALMNGIEHPSAPALDTSRTIHAAAPRHALPVAPPVSTADLAAHSTIGSLPVADLPGESAAREGRWQVGLRDNFRLSLPRVYGLGAGRSILFDKDLVATYRMDGGHAGLLSSFRLGLTLGETEFSQILHTNTGGMPVDTIIEQSPTLQYLRLLLAPELFRTPQVSGSLELGGGGAMQRFRMIGPFATFGVNLEYRPVDMLSIQAGGGSWLLWSEFRNQTYVSTNLNAHLGFAVGF